MNEVLSGDKERLSSACSDEKASKQGMMMFDKKIRAGKLEMFDKFKDEQYKDVRGVFEELWG